MDKTTAPGAVVEFGVRIEAGSTALEGSLGIPGLAHGVVLFAHGSGSSRRSPRNRFVARELRAAGLATLLIDLLSAEEEVIDQQTTHLRFDIGLLAGRLIAATDWLGKAPGTAGLPICYFGASTGGGAALVAAVQRPQAVRAVVSRGGRPDLAGPALPSVQAPTLLIVGGEDRQVIRLNEEALSRLGASEKQLAIVPGASHLFQEPGKLQEVSRLATAWFYRYLKRGK